MLSALASGGRFLPGVETPGFDEARRWRLRGRGDNLRHPRREMDVEILHRELAGDQAREPS